MEFLTSPTVSPTHHTANPGDRVEISCSILNINTSLNVSWVKRTNAMAESVFSTASYHLHGHVLVLESVLGERDSGHYCCLVGGSQQEEACTELSVFRQGELDDGSAPHKGLLIEKQNGAKLE